LYLNSGLSEFSILKSAASRVYPTCGVKPGNDAELDRFDTDTGNPDDRIRDDWSEESSTGACAIDLARDQ
jgi:hypothetical protein